MPVPAGPGAPLVVAEAELLLAILVEALHGPPFVAEPQLAGQRQRVQAPGEVPLRVPLRLRQRALPHEPSWGPRDVAVGSMDPDPARLPLRRAAPAVADGHRLPPVGGHGGGGRFGRMQRGDVDRMGMRGAWPAGLLLRWQGPRRGGDDLLRAPDPEGRADLHDVGLRAGLQAGEEGWEVAVGA